MTFNSYLTVGSGLKENKSLTTVKNGANKINLEKGMLLCGRAMKAQTML